MDKKTFLISAMSVAMGGASFSANAFDSLSVLNFTGGAAEISGCGFGTINPTTGTCTFNGTPTGTELTDMGGSYFGMDTNGGGVSPGEKTAISQFAALAFAGGQLAAGSHAGAPDGSETPAIDNAWGFSGATGMHGNSAAITDVTGSGATRTLDLPGWQVVWSGFDETNPITMPGQATIVCSTANCAVGDTYTLDMSVHVPVAFTSTPYELHLEGSISAVPVPAAAWLFGSGLVGLVGVARRRRNK